MARILHASTAATRFSYGKKYEKIHDTGGSHDGVALYMDIKNGETSQELVFHSIDILMDGAGFIPVAGPWISLSYSLLREPVRDYLIIPTYEAIVH